MKKLIFVALFAAPLSVQAAHYSQESVSFDKAGKPFISAQLTRPAITPNYAKNADDSAQQQTKRHSKSPSELQHGLYTDDHFVYTDESYLDAIHRWTKRDGVNNLALSLNEKTTNALSLHPGSTISFKGTTLDVINQLSRQLGEPFKMALDEYHHLAAIHQWQNREVQVSLVGGKTLKDELKNLTLDYGWQWMDNPTKPSYMASHDYAVSVSYPIVTPKGDLKRALNIALKGYPVSAKLLDGSHTLFIVDTH